MPSVRISDANNGWEADVDEEALKARVAELIERANPQEQGVAWTTRANEVFQGTITVLEAAYGVGSSRVASFVDAFTTIRDGGGGAQLSRMYEALRVARGALDNLKAELDADLVGNLRQRLTGGVLSDFIVLARTVLEGGTDGVKNVAAVLAAAAYEDTIRRMGDDLAGVAGRPDLPDVIEALKKAGVLQSPQLGIALSYLSFRNHALHANWEKIALEAVHSVLAFVEQLLLKHFA
jgi:hypothetical protein